MKHPTELLNYSKRKKQAKENHNVTSTSQISSTEDPFKCRECFTKFKQKRNLARHFETVHQRLRQFSCSFCEKSFSSKQILERHSEKIHKTTLPIELQLYGAPKIPRFLSCLKRSTWILREGRFSNRSIEDNFS